MNVYTIAIVTAIIAIAAPSAILFLTWFLLTSTIIVWVLYESELLPQSMIDTIQKYCNSYDNENAPEPDNEQKEPEQALLLLTNDNVVYIPASEDQLTQETIKSKPEPIEEPESIVAEIHEEVIIESKSKPVDFDHDEFLKRIGDQCGIELVMPNESEPVTLEMEEKLREEASCYSGLSPQAIVFIKDGILTVTL